MLKPPIYNHDKRLFIIWPENQLGDVVYLNAQKWCFFVQANRLDPVPCPLPSRSNVPFDGFSGNRNEIKRYLLPASLQRTILSIASSGMPKGHFNQISSWPFSWSLFVTDLATLNAVFMNESLYLADEDLKLNTIEVRLLEIINLERTNTP